MVMHLIPQITCSDNCLAPLTTMVRKTELAHDTMRGANSTQGYLQTRDFC